MSLKFSTAYRPGYWSGEMLKARLEADGLEFLTLTITAVEARPFRDVGGSEWVLSFGDGEAEFRLRAKQWANGRALAAAFGDRGERWVGQTIELRARHVEWVDRETGEHKAGWTIDIRPVLPPANLPPIEEDLDDEVPF